MGRSINPSSLGRRQVGVDAESPQWGVFQIWTVGSALATLVFLSPVLGFSGAIAEFW